MKLAAWLVVIDCIGGLLYTFVLWQQAPYEYSFPPPILSLVGAVFMVTLLVFAMGAVNWARILLGAWNIVRALVAFGAVLSSAIPKTLQPAGAVQGVLALVISVLLFHPKTAFWVAATQAQRWED
jgi:hypothetical protein